MKKNLREEYINNANSLISRLLWEQEDEDTPPADEAPEAEENPDIEEEPEQGQSEQVEIFFDNLDEDSQKVLLNALKENLNITEDDEFAHEKLIKTLTEKPLVTFRAEELVRKLNIDI